MKLINVFVALLLCSFISCKSEKTNTVFYANYGCAHVFEFSEDGYGTLKVGEYEIDLDDAGSNIYNVKLEREFRIIDSDLSRLNEILKKIEKEKTNLKKIKKKDAWCFGINLKGKPKVRTYGNMVDSYNEILRILLKNAKGKPSFDCADY